MVGNELGLYQTNVDSAYMGGLCRSWSGAISLPELRRSELLAHLVKLDEIRDINEVGLWVRALTGVYFPFTSGCSRSVSCLTPNPPCTRTYTQH